MTSRTVWQALARPDFLLTSWPWRSAGYLLSSAPVGLVTLVGMLVATGIAGGLSLVVVGLPLLALLGLAGLPVAAVERWRLRLIDTDPAPGGHRMPDRPGLVALLRTRYREQATWWELAYALLFAVVLWPLDLLTAGIALSLPLGLVATPVLMATFGHGHGGTVLKTWTVSSYPEAFALALLGLVLLGVAGYVLGPLAGARGALTRLLTSPREDALGRRINELTRSRGRLVDAFEAERRRIERDLHDGAQQRLVALTVTLGLARLDAPPGPVADLIAKAHDEAGEVLVSLRELIRGIHPKVLADYGLAAAIPDVAERSSVPVDVRVELPGRMPDAVEATAYFVVCEALTNIARHSGATRATVVGGYADGRLTVAVSDNGRGGASAGKGSGLVGLADRVSVVDGRLELSSPPGGPTLLRVELPCEMTLPTVTSG
ncbi:Signal transduction histidine kinase [Actinacidiphila yanglinensis]|uniref:histidine kinase n=1 Tax=Actinacidiphila yanglinensis TaxID=310779 RepID=A0A1H5YZ59_9ACTN|nr:sensor domain-containing protein [Actinacidiphila yanglinensis]SEG28456.1 Signal transduction histidine kinase [Actinacidiphila yanglinensis]